MTVEQLRRTHTAEPFIPFDVSLADGRVLHVPHPEFLWMPPKAERTFLVSDDQGIAETVDLLMVVSLRLSKSGQSRRRKAG